MSNREAILHVFVAVVIATITALTGYGVGQAEGKKKSLTDMLGCDDQQMAICNPEKRECWCSP